MTASCGARSSKQVYRSALFVLNRMMNIDIVGDRNQWNRQAVP